MNCSVVPLTIVPLSRSIVMYISVAELTVMAEDPDTPANVAVIVVEPAAVEVANPLEPAALLIAATPVLDELQVADAVRSCVVLSEKVPVAVNCFVVPCAMLGLVGVIAMDKSVAGVTVKVVDPEMLPDAAVIVVDPAAAAEPSP